MNTRTLRILCNVTASLLVIAVLVIQVPPEAYADPGATATTYTVNTTSDSGDGTCDAEECTLREAINAANANLGQDTINFDMPYLDAPYPVIAPYTSLPKITDDVIIDGSTQEPHKTAGLSGDNGGDWGLFDDSAGATIKSMAIIGFDGPGIVLEGSGQHVIEDSILDSNEYGIRMVDSDWSYIDSNVIRSNEKDGIVIVGDGSRTNQITQNSIYDNGELGIDLGDDGVTENDVVTGNDVGENDDDTGPNGLQNYPILTRVESTYAKGYLYSTPNTQFRVECFGNQALDPTGHGEGKTYLGHEDIKTDEQGEAFFDIDFATDSGANVACTATSLPTGDTSEFSSVLNELIVNSGGDAPDEEPGSGGCDTGDTVTIDGNELVECTLRAAIQEANFTSRPDKITFRWDPTLLTINPSSPLPPIEEMTDINGRTRSKGVIISGEGLHFKADHGTLRGIEVKGSPGVGVEADGTLYLEDVQIRDSAQEGVKAVGDVTISGGATASNEITDNGGAGLYTQDGKVTIEDVLIEGSEGWGIDGGGYVHITTPGQYDAVTVRFNEEGGVRSRHDQVRTSFITVQWNGDPGITVWWNGGPGIWSDEGEVYLETLDGSASNAATIVSNNEGTGIGAALEVGLLGEGLIKVVGNGQASGDPGIYSQKDQVTLESRFKVSMNGGWGIDAAKDVYLVPGQVVKTDKTSTVSENGAGGVRSRHGHMVRSGFRECVSCPELAGDPVEVKNNGGPGIWASHATIDVAGSDISDNQGPGIKTGGDVHLHGSDNTVSGNGKDQPHRPGIYTNEGEVTADIATVNKNSGWGINAAGSVTIDATDFPGRSQISHNGSGGSGIGGGIRSREGEIVVRDADVTGNAGGPGIWAQKGSVELRDVNVSNNAWGGVEALTGVRIVGGSNQVNENGEANEGAGIDVSHGDVTIAGYTKVSENFGWGLTVSGTLEFWGLYTTTYAVLNKPSTFERNDGGGLLVDVDDGDKGAIFADWLALINNGGHGLQTNGATTYLSSGRIISNTGYGAAILNGELILMGTEVRNNDQGGITFELNSGGTQQALASQEADAVVGETTLVYDSAIVENDGDGLRYEGGGSTPVAESPAISRTNLVDNTGYGVNNAASGVTIEAQGNWWGDAAGPDGDDTKGSVNTANWRTEPVSIVVAPRDATLLAAGASTTTMPVYVYNRSEPTGVVTMTLADTQGWLAGDATFAAALTETGVIVPVPVAVPGDTALDTTDTVTVTATSQADPTVTESDTFQVRVAEVADLSLEKSAPGRVHAGAPFTVTLVVANDGPDDATGVTVTDTLPSSAAFVSSEDCKS